MMALLQDAKPKARRKPVITTTPTSSTPSPTSASVPMMITKQMRLQLSQDANLTEAQIRKLTPQQAHDILDKIPKPKSTASTSSTISSDKTTLHPLTGNKVKSSKNKDATPKEGAPTSMAGPALGGLFGFVVAFGGAGYYFFGNNDEEEASPFNTVVQMIRGKEEDNDGTNASSSSTNNDDMSLEEYEKLQASNQFSKTLENVKGLGASSLPEKDKNENTNTNDTTTNQTDTEPKRELTMMEKLEQAKRRGNTAGISSKKLKRLPPQKPAWMLAEEEENKLQSNIPILALNSACFTLYNISSYILLGKIQLSFHAIGNSVRQVVVIFCSIFFLGSTLTIDNVFGIFCVASGAVCYKICKKTVASKEIVNGGNGGNGGNDGVQLMEV